VKGKMDQSGADLLVAFNVGGLNFAVNVNVEGSVLSPRAVTASAVLSTEDNSAMDGELHGVGINNLFQLQRIVISAHLDLQSRHRAWRIHFAVKAAICNEQMEPLTFTLTNELNFGKLARELARQVKSHLGAAASACTTQAVNSLTGGGAANEGRCTRFSGGTCSVWSCYSSRGPTDCINSKCMCKQGMCAHNGKCTYGTNAEEEMLLEQERIFMGLPAPKKPTPAPKFMSIQTKQAKLD